MIDEREISPDVVYQYLYDMDGNMTVDFVIDEIVNLQYTAKEVVSCSLEENYEGYRVIYDVARCQAYIVKGAPVGNDCYGLISPEGKVLTPPEYSGIQAVGEDMYLCHPDGILINGQGEKVDY